MPKLTSLAGMMLCCSCAIRSLSAFLYVESAVSESVVATVRFQKLVDASCYHPLQAHLGVLNGNPMHKTYIPHEVPRHRPASISMTS